MFYHKTQLIRQIRVINLCESNNITSKYIKANTYRITRIYKSTIIVGDVNMLLSIADKKKDARIEKIWTLQFALAPVATHRPLHPTAADTPAEAGRQGWGGVGQVESRIAAHFWTQAPNG